MEGDEVVEQVLDVLEDFEAVENAVEQRHNRWCLLFWPRLRGAGAHATEREKKIARIYSFLNWRILVKRS